MSGANRHFNYVSDDGNTYLVMLNEENSLAVGGTVATTGPSKPSGMVPRYLLAQHPTTGRELKVKCPNPTDDAWLGATETLALHVRGATATVTFVIRGRVGERRYKRG